MHVKVRNIGTREIIHNEDSSKRTQFTQNFKVVTQLIKASVRSKLLNICNQFGIEW